MTKQSFELKTSVSIKKAKIFLISIDTQGSEWDDPSLLAL